MSQLKRKLITLGLALLIFSPWQTVLPASSTYRGNVFVEMMLKMMEIMVEIIDQDPEYSKMPYPMSSQYFNPYFNPALGMQPFYGSPWSNMAQKYAYQQMLTPFDPSSTGQFFGNPPFMPQNPTQAVIPFLPDSGPAPTAPLHLKYMPHWIEGRWIASDNMILEVWQGEFKMYYRNRPSEVRGGLIRLKDRWLAIHEQTRQITRQFEYAIEDDKLVLKDLDGNVMLFHRSQNWGNPLR
jgi:hypothetical protein